MQDPEDIVDYHVHLVGHGDGGSGCTVHQAVSGCGQGVWSHSHLYSMRCIRPSSGGSRLNDSRQLSSCLPLKFRTWMGTYYVTDLYRKFMVCMAHRLQCKTQHFTKHKLPEMFKCN